MENSIAVANYFIKKALSENVELTPMKLVKLVYIAHGWHLALNGSALISEDVQAWKYGPVIDAVYQRFRHLGSGRITQPALSHVSFVDGRVVYEITCPEVKTVSVRTFLDKVWDVYKNFSGIELSAMTHQENTPWYEAYNKLGGKEQKSFTIPNELIKSHYVQLANGR